MQVIEIENLNNKLSNDVFIHIADAPEKALLLPITVKVKETKRSNRSSLEMLDGPAETQPIEFAADLVDLGRMHLNDLSHIFTYMSHACSYSEFIDRYAKTFKSYNVAVYVFKRRAA